MKRIILYSLVVFVFLILSSSAFTHENEFTLSDSYRTLRYLGGELYIDEELVDVYCYLDDNQNVRCASKTENESIMNEQEAQEWVTYLD